MTQFEKGKELIRVTTTRSDGSQHKCFYLYDTAASWASRNSDGSLKPGVSVFREPYDGFSMVITDNGD